MKLINKLIDWLNADEIHEIDVTRGIIVTTCRTFLLAFIFILLTILILII